MTVTIHAESTSGTMHLNAAVSFICPDLDTALRRIRQAVGDALPIFVDPDAGTNTLRRD